MSKLVIDSIIKYLGQPLKKCGNELIWQCPVCMDKGKDNLKYNIAKNILYCFANPEHSKAILREINKIYDENYSKTKIMPMKYTTEPAILTQNQINNFENYMYKCNETLLLDKNLLKILYDKRGLTSTTVSMAKIGFDNTKNIWTIPTIKYSCDNSQIIGFEFRPYNLSKNGLYRTKGTPTELAMINDYYNDIDTLCVIEGYFDGYSLLQYLAEQKEDKFYHIVTPTNGIQTLLNHLLEIDYSRYKKFYLFIDNDDVSNNVKLKILEKYPQFEPINMTCGCKDFNEHYLNCIKGVKCQNQTVIKI